MVDKLKDIIRSFRFPFLLFSVFLFIFSFLHAHTQSVQYIKPKVYDNIWMDVNRMNGVFSNDGIFLYDVILGDWGLEWPKDAGTSPIFAAGMDIAYLKGSDLHLSAIMHSRAEFQPGQIIEPDSAADPEDERYRWYWLDSEGNGDWDNWPVDQGAPVDENGNPLLLGNKTIFSVWSDYADHAYFGGLPLGVEVRQTAFAYSEFGALEDVIFIQWQLVNKSGKTWDNTHFSIWLDPDLGDAGDDRVGCDTLLNLGFCYNSRNDDQNYGKAPPSVGMQILQGVLVDSSGSTVTLPDGRVFEDKWMMKMRRFNWPYKHDGPTGTPQTASEIWNYMNGYWRDGSLITQDGYEGINQGYPPARFMFPGDPVSGEGWSFPHDRSMDVRMLLTIEPFEMQAWTDPDGDGRAELGEPGVQEIIGAVLVARGWSNLNSVTQLKKLAHKLELVYQSNFQLAGPPIQAQVQVSERSGEIILSWDDVSELNPDGTPYESKDIFIEADLGDTLRTIAGDEIIAEYVIDDVTYNFNAYTIYQFSDESGSDPVEYARYEVGMPKEGNRYDGPRHIRIRFNQNPKAGPVGNPLADGSTYYFGVEAEAYCRFSNPQRIQSKMKIVAVTPHATPGERYGSEQGDTIAVAHTLLEEALQSSDGRVDVFVVDPSRTTGDDYQVIFHEAGAGSSLWDLIDVTTGDTLLKRQSNQSGDELYTVVDGLLVRVMGPNTGVKEVFETDPDGSVVDPRVSIVRSSLGTTGYIVTNIAGDWNNIGALVRDWDRWDYWAADDLEIDFSRNSLSWDEASQQVNFDCLSGEACHVPFAVYRHIFSSAEVQRLFAGFRDSDEDGTWNMPMTEGEYDWVDPSWGRPCYEPIYCWVGYDAEGNEINYDPSNDAQYIADNDLRTSAHLPESDAGGRFPNPYVTDLLFCMYQYGATPPWGNRVYFRMHRPNTPNDVFSFTAPPAPVITNDDLKADLEKINVVPNPYYAFHSQEQSIDDHWVQFTYLPERCTIRIFDLAGNLIRKLEKNDASTPFLRWDLTSQWEYPLASGVYVYLVEVPGIGVRHGKLAIFRSQEYLQVY